MLDVVLLSRIQFSLTIMFHYLFPPLSIGLGLLLVIMEGLYIKTGDPDYEAMTKFWVKIFGVNFAMGVASGIVMEFQFGTNWATYSRYVGDVFGSALAAEGIFAFFLESGFLAVLVFGWDRVSKKMHFFSCLMVFLGSMFSAIWIVVANSWMQTPAGFQIVGEGLSARAEITDFWAMVFNPSSVDRLIHVLIGAFLMGAFFVMSVMGYYLLKNRHVSIAKKSFSIALVVACVFSWLALFTGHRQAAKLVVTQPAKLAAFEGVFKTEPRTPAYLFGVPDAQNQVVELGVKVPGFLSWLVHGDVEKPVTGLDQFARTDWPPVGLSFQTYHVMVVLGMFFIVFTTLGVVLLLSKRLFSQRAYFRLAVWAVLGPVIANQAGWVAAEVGRQPWIVYGLLRTSDAVSKVVKAEQVLGSIIMFTLIYILLLMVWVFVVDKKIKQGPVDLSEYKDSDGKLSDTLGHLAGPSGPSLTDAKEGQ